MHVPKIIIQYFLEFFDCELAIIVLIIQFELLAQILPENLRPAIFQIDTQIVHPLLARDEPRFVLV